ncbi:hypothetical protein CK623_02770 [Vandammella animalimorsus]|uniref:Host-nuclease inhibitor protein Gam n=1 Tax=Vandammella animalimorsus TaxID=2029117 RepID=A0A2A2ATX5_9BURK|nr:hypothetical protein [Vandammella animalimorsus]PAT41181.1 hypothetical protein CK623_02770 [Vandammella animalimorsus]
MDTQTTNPMTAIAAAARSYRQHKDVLTERAQGLHDALEGIKRQRLAGLRSAVARVTEAEAALRAAIEASPQLFIRPRTVVLEGIKLGYQKGKGKISWDDDAQVVRLIRRHLPDAADALIQSREVPIKAALAGLSAAELKRVGVSISDADDEVVIKDTTATVDKLVAALLKGAEEEAGEAV